MAGAQSAHAMASDDRYRECSDRPESGGNHDAEYKENIEAREHIY